MQSALVLLNRPLVVPLFTTVTLSSLTCFGAIMLEFVGPLKVMDDKVGPVGVKATEKAKGFAAYFRRVAVIMAGSATLSAVISIYIAYRTPNRDLRQVSIFSAVGNLINHPYTVVLLLPTNKKLLALGDKAQKAQLTARESREVEELSAKWGRRHLGRFVGFAAGWMGAIAGLALAV